MSAKNVHSTRGFQTNMFAIGGKPSRIELQPPRFAQNRPVSRNEISCDKPEREFTVYPSDTFSDPWSQDSMWRDAFPTMQDYTLHEEDNLQYTMKKDASKNSRQIYSYQHGQEAQRADIKSKIQTAQYTPLPIENSELKQTSMPHIQRKKRAMDTIHSNEPKSTAGVLEGYVYECLANKAPPSVQPLCNIIGSCAQNPSITGCETSFTSLTCPQMTGFFTQLQNDAGQDAIDGYCGGVRDFVNYLNNQGVGQDAGKLIDWYENTYAPCTAQICAGSTNPISQADLTNGVKSFARNVIKGQLSTMEQFYLQYGVAVTIVLVAIVIVLLFAITRPKQ